MPNIILPEHGSSTAMTITLASLANGSAQQPTMVNNLNVGSLVHLYFLVTTGTSPTLNSLIEFYLLCGDDPASSNIRTDNAGASDAAITIVSADQVFAQAVSASSNVSYRNKFSFLTPGPEWGIAVKNSTGVALNATGSNHALRYVTENFEIQ